MSDGRPRPNSERDLIVVRREPELVQREAKRLYRGDDEKVATAGFNNLNVRGVIIYSRYQKAHELETMIQMVTRLQADRIGYVERIWCDSQVGCSYNVVLRHKNLPDPLVRGHLRDNSTGVFRYRWWLQLAQCV
jgi:hypothetical protein